MPSGEPMTLGRAFFRTDRRGQLILVTSVCRVSAELPGRLHEAGSSGGGREVTKSSAIVVSQHALLRCSPNRGHRTRVCLLASPLLLRSMRRGVYARGDFLGARTWDWGVGEMNEILC